MPQLGETVAEGTVTKWFKRVGDSVEKGETLFEVSTDKVDTEIPAQSSGVLSALYVEEGETVDVGTVVAVISADIEVSGHEVSAASPFGTKTDAAGEHGGLPQPPTHARLQLSPAVRRLLQERGLSPSEVVGTGPGGRITKDDVVSHVTPLAEAPTQSPVVRRLLAEHGIDASTVMASVGGSRLTRHDVEAFIARRPLSTSPSADDEAIPFTRMRRLTAEHVVRSKSTSAHTLMVREVDYETVERARKRQGIAFKEREGFSLTYLPFSAYATLVALGSSRSSTLP